MIRVTEAQMAAARAYLGRYLVAKEERDRLAERIVEARETRAVATYAAAVAHAGGTISDPVGQASQRAIQAEQEYADRAAECLAIMHGICKAIDKLDYPTQRQALEYAFIQGLTNRQAAEKAGCTIQTHQNRKKAGIQAIAENMAYMT